MAKTYPITGFCPLYHRAMEIIGRRWTGAIVRALTPAEGVQAGYVTGQNYLLDGGAYPGTF